MRPQASCRAFTLIELLIVMAVIAILASMTIALMSNVRSAARSVACQNSVRQLGMASISWAVDNRGQWPKSEWADAPRFWGMRIGEFMANFSGKSFAIGERPTVPFACPESKWVPQPGPIAFEFGSDFSKNMYAGGYSDWWYPSMRSMSSYPTSTTMGYAENPGGKTANDEATRELSQDIQGPAAGTWGMGFWRHRSRSNAVFMDGHVESMLQESIQFKDIRQAPWSWPN